MFISYKFTKKYKNTLFLSFQTAQKDGYSLLLPEHLFYTLLSQKGTIAHQIFKKTKTTQKELKKALNISPRPSLNLKGKKTLLSTSSKNIIKKSAILAFSFKHPFIGTEHIFYSLLQNKTINIKNFFQLHKIDHNQLKEQINFVLKNISKLYLSPSSSLLENTPPFSVLEKEIENFFPENIHLKKEVGDFFSELTDPFLSQKLDPVIGREKELGQITKILGRRKKNNPLLIGDPGVGKTAIVEGLAKNIAELKIPSFLFGKKIIKLDLSAILAGSIYRGEFEARLKNIIDQARDQETILFIDEIHNIVGAGSSSGSLDAAHILKPILTNNSFCLIGATTFSDYKKYIEKDKALARRFEMVKITEPNFSETKKIIKKAKKYYEKHHQIAISDKSIEEAILLSQKYINNRRLPDKAFDIIDQTASWVKIKKQKNNFSFLRKRMEEELQEIKQQKNLLIENEKYTDALFMKKTEKGIKKELNIVQNLQDKEKKEILGKITPDDIRATLSEMLNIPLEKISSTFSLKKTLGSQIIGQEKALNAIDKHLKRIMLEINHTLGPLGSFIFLGPSGIGKTETAKQIARLVFKTPSSFLKLDMSEFNEKFTISQLIGAPAGYIGYEEGGKLTEFVKNNPYSLILFDEIEKAHPGIFNILLQILEDGVLTDMSGESVSFKNTVIILTSNLGTEDFYSSPLGFNPSPNNWKETEKKIKEKLSKTFRPELINRFDQIITFEPLSEEALKKIIIHNLKQLATDVSSKYNLAFSIDKTALSFLTQTAWEQKQGARGVKKMIQKNIENEIAEFLLETKREKTIKLNKGNITLQKIQ